MPAVTRKETPIHKMNKLQIIRALQWQHPTVTLDVGTLEANTKRVTEGNESAEVLRCLREAVHQAADLKRSCLQLLGRFVERVTDPTATFTKEQKALDRDLQDLICPRISGTSLDEDDEDERVNDDTDSEANEDIQQSFLKKLVTYLHSRKDIQGDSVDVQRTKAFIHRAEGLHLLEPRDMAAIQNMMAYPGSVLARNISMQMSVEDHLPELREHSRANGKALQNIQQTKNIK